MKIYVRNMQDILGFSRRKSDIAAMIEENTREIIQHLIKLWLYSDAETCNHWKQEVYGFLYQVPRLKGSNKFPSKKFILNNTIVINADVTFTVINRSPDLKAKLCSADIVVTGGSASTFTSTASLPSATGTPACVELNANGGETTIVVRTTLNTTPVTTVDANNLQVQFTAQPVANR